MTDSENECSPLGGIPENLTYVQHCYSQAKFCDLRLFGSDQILPINCHGLVICSAFPALKQVLARDWHFGGGVTPSEDITATLVLQGANSEELRSLIDAIYTNLTEGGSSLEISVSLELASCLNYGKEYQYTEPEKKTKPLDEFIAEDSDSEPVAAPQPPKRKRGRPPKSKALPPTKLPTLAPKRKPLKDPEDDEYSPTVIKRPRPGNLRQRLTVSRLHPSAVITSRHAVMGVRERSDDDKVPSYEGFNPFWTLEKVHEAFNKTTALLPKVYMNKTLPTALVRMVKASYFSVVVGVGRRGLRFMARPLVWTKMKVEEENDLEEEDDRLKALIGLLWSHYNLSSSTVYNQPKLLGSDWKRKSKEELSFIKAMKDSDYETLQEETYSQISALELDNMDSDEKPMRAQMFDVVGRRDLVVDKEFPLGDVETLAVITFADSDNLLANATDWPDEVVCTAFPIKQTALEPLELRFLKLVLEVRGGTGGEEGGPPLPLGLRQRMEEVCKLYLIKKSSGKKTDPQAVICDECGKQVKKYQFKEHMTLHDLHCKQCDVTFKNAHQNRQHLLLEHSEGKYYSCDTCTKVISRKNEDEHVRVCGQSQEECLCPDCGDVLRSKSLLSFHISYKHRMHRCKECNKEFLGGNALAVHKRADHGNYQCDQCDKVCSNKMNLKYHVLRIHCTDEQRPCKCDYCGKGFVNEKSKRNHVGSVHLGERPFPCRFGCSFAFGEDSNRRAHEKAKHGAHGGISVQDTQTGKWVNVSQFPCTDCPKVFNDKVKLEHHVKRMHTSEAEKPFTCDQCGKGFLFVKPLQRHIEAVHTKSGSYICRFGCGASFNEEGNRRGHERKVHKAGPSNRELKLLAVERQVIEAQQKDQAPVVISSDALGVTIAEVQQQHVVQLPVSEQGQQTAQLLQVHPAVGTGQMQVQVQVVQTGPGGQPVTIIQPAVPQ